MPGDDGFSASELRKRNLRGGTVADDELSCAHRLLRSPPPADPPPTAAGQPHATDTAATPPRLCAV
eukprot:COSAG04_NODE_28298_length_276_cov_1.084746_1_plen_65_part_10